MQGCRHSPLRETGAAVRSTARPIRTEKLRRSGYSAGDLHRAAARVWSRADPSDERRQNQGQWFRLEPRVTNTKLEAAVKVEWQRANSAVADGDLGIAFAHLERAHILSQRLTLMHVR